MAFTDGLDSEFVRRERAANRRAAQLDMHAGTAFDRADSVPS